MPERRAVRIATWNVNSLKARLPRVLQFLSEHRPDVLCLQETKSSPEAFPHDEFADAGYVAADHSAGRWAGVAVVAPAGAPPALAARGLPGEVDAIEARWVEADVGGIRVASVYVPNGRAVGSPPFEAKLTFLIAMAARVAALRGRPLIVAGDMNVAPSDLDVYEPRLFVGSTHVTREERSGLQMLLNIGLVDAYRHLHPDGVGFTWWDYRAGHFHKHLGLRIDLALLSPDLAAGLTSCGIDRTYRKGPKPSDHAPLLLELDDPDLGPSTGPAD